MADPTRASQPVRAALQSSISPIRVSASGRYFVDPAGKPVFWLGDTQWELFRLWTPQVAMRILKDRQAKGFNVILIMLTGVDTRYVEAESQKDCINLEGQKPWLDNDLSRPNERYFQHVDRIIHMGEQTGQTFVVGVLHQWHWRLAPLAKTRPWARWVANRYRDVHNLIWCMYPKATEEFVPVCRELAAGLRDGDGGTHLITVHPDPSVASSSFLHEEPWLAFNMIQTCISYDKIHEAVTADYRRVPAKPVVMAEGGYEGREFDKLQTPHDIRKQAYWSWFAGGYHVYGHNDHWRYPLRIDNWLNGQGAAHLRVFRDVITSLPAWWDMVPDQSIIASGQGSGEQLNTAARSADGRWVIVYLSVPSTVSVRLDALCATGALPVSSVADRPTSTWIDPRCGDRTPAPFSAAGGPSSFTTPSGWEDALLLLEAK